MNRRTFLTGLPVAATFSGVLPAFSAPPTPPAAGASDSFNEEERARVTAARATDPRPNILLLFTDQQTAEALSCAGNPRVKTPVMDHLAAHGIRYTRAYCNNPVCGPSRASMLTGRTAREAGVRFNGQTPDTTVPLLGELLSQHGYDTVWSGKWHLPRSYVFEPEIRGFRNLPLPEGLKGTHLGDVTDMACAQMASAFLRWEAPRSSQPWFLGVSLHNPHDICHYFEGRQSHLVVGEPDPLSRDPETLPPLPENFRADPDEPEVLLARRQRGELAQTRDTPPLHWRAYLDRYYRLTESVDRCFAPVLDALHAGGWAENTLIIVTSDHGEGMASHQWNTKLGFYEPIVRIPFILVPPGGLSRPQPRVDQDPLVSLLDVTPTILDYAGVPAGEWPLLHGTSLRPLAGDPAQRMDRKFLVIDLDPLYHRREVTARLVVSADGWKYMVFDEGTRREQLFNLQRDPLEQQNLVGDPAARTDLARLRQHLRDWCEQTADPFLPLIPDA